MGLVEAGAQPRETTKQLETVEGGWIKIRRLTHGESTERLDSILTFQPDQSGGDEGKTFVSTTRQRQHDFAACILDHNIGIGGTKVNFKDPKQISALDSGIGDEIDGLIQAHNEPLEPGDEEDDDTPNL